MLRRRNEPTPQNPPSKHSDNSKNNNNTNNSPTSALNPDSKKTQLTPEQYLKELANRPFHEKYFEELIAFVLLLLITILGVLLHAHKTSQKFTCNAWKTKHPSNQNSLSPLDYNRYTKFCDQHGSKYAQFCDCKPLPTPIIHKHSHLVKNYKSPAPILIIASCRPQYLFRTLKSLEQAFFAVDHNIVVSTDCDDKSILGEILDVVEVFKIKSLKRLPYIKVVTQKIEKSCSNRITHHYFLAISHLVNVAYPKSSYFIVLEDDLLVSEDFLHYLYAHTPLLEREQLEKEHSKPSSVWCVSAWNDHGYLHSSESPNQIYRVDGWPGLGWIAKTSLFRSELLPQWPLHGASDWDMWLRTERTRDSRSCIIPDVSRTFHFGRIGKNMNEDWQEQYFARHKLHKSDGLKLLNFQPINRLERNRYNEMLERLIFRESIKLKEELICNEKNGVQPFLLTPVPQLDAKYVIKIPTDFPTDRNLEIFGCLKVWDLDVRGIYMGVLRIHYNKVQLTVVFCNLNVRFCNF